MPARVLITSALPYANGPLHFGHITGAYLPADAYARFRRLLGDEVLYLCGSDEYGIAITLNAERAGMGYQEYVDMYHKIHKDTFAKLNISVNYFSRTTNSFHCELVQNFYQALKANGFIKNHVSDHLYSEEEGRFLADRYVEGTCPKCGFEGARGDECQCCGADYEATSLKNPRSKLTGSPLVLKKTEHAYLHLDMLIAPLQEFASSLYLVEHVRNFVVDYINHLQPRAITRDISWGVPVPDMENKVFYVWFDALIGYISGTMDWAHAIGEPEAWKAYWLDPTTEYHQFVGKDNIPFHAAVFPAIEIGQSVSYNRARALISSEFYLLEGSQFSKSEGNYVNLDAFLGDYAVDKLRYVLASTAPETSDSEFTFAGFKTRCNSELIGKLGNFVNRTLAFAEKNQIRELSHKHVNLERHDQEFIQKIFTIVDHAETCYHKYSLRKACSVIMELATLGNCYFNDQAPWKSIRDGQLNRVETILFCTSFCQKLLALIAYPIMPDTACAIWRMLSPHSLSKISYSPQIAQNLWNHDFKCIEESFSLQTPQLLFTVVD